MAEMKQREEMNTGVNDWKKVNKHRNGKNFRCCPAFSFSALSCLENSRNVNVPVLTSFP